MMFSWLRRNSGAAADVYIDLGTANTVVAVHGKGIVLNEPSLVAYSVHAGKKQILAVGQAAKEVMSKTPGNVFAQKPVRDGVIADFDLAHEMLRQFLTRKEIKKLISRPRVVVSLPYGVTEVEKRAVIEACAAAGARDVFLIDEPMAAAIGSDLPIREATGCMVIDIGGGTTEIAVIALSDIVSCQAVRVGGHRIDEAIVSHFRNHKNLIISETQAEELKIAVGSAVPKKTIITSEVTGRDVETGLPRTIEVNSEDLGQAMNPCIQEIIDAVHRALENTPPELVSDIIEKGLTLAGGGALIRHLDLRLKHEIRIPVRVANEPLLAIARGGEMVLDDPELLDKIQLEV